ncbi:hypothetical protein K502DRAFT_325970 [Neoconidiobolus thromboides FSU 785]|nr:hypothetical protein K502DRAFT_325970 [Neoconidiobolus thromboides FSU 785]
MDFDDTNLSVGLTQSTISNRRKALLKTNEQEERLFTPQIENASTNPTTNGINTSIRETKPQGNRSPISEGGIRNLVYRNPTEQSNTFLSKFSIPYTLQILLLLLLVSSYYFIKILYIFEISEESDSKVWLFYQLYAVLKWTLLDSILFGFAMYFNLFEIKREFGSKTLGAILVTMAAVNTSIIFKIGWIFSPFTYFLPGTKTEASSAIPIVQDNFQGIGLSNNKLLSREEILTGNQHLSGRYTVKILPDSSVKFNTEDHHFCLIKDKDDKYRKDSILIFINGTNPNKMEVEYSKIGENKSKIITIKLKQFSKDNIKTKENGDKIVVGHYEYSIDKPGKYRFNNVYDGEGNQFSKLGKEFELNIAPCPTAKINNISHDQLKPSDYCLSTTKEPLNTNIVVYGIGPMEVTYNLKDQSNNMFSKTIITDIIEKDTLKEQQFNVDFKFDKPGKYEYQIAKIRDYYGNTIDYEGLKKYNNEKELEGYLTAHSKPDAYFNFKNKKLYLSPIKKEQQLSFSAQGEPYVNVTIGLCKLDKDCNNIENYKVYDIKQFNDDYDFYVKHVGYYKILSVTDAYCKNDMIKSKIVKVEKLPKPELMMDNQPILSTCNKEIGMEFNLTLAGDVPFVLDYNIIGKQDDGTKVNNRKSIKLMNLINYIKIIPEHSGNYEYKFTKLTNEAYGQVKLTNEYHQIVNAQPIAKFITKENKDIKLCLNEDIQSNELFVQLNGKFPLQLEYSIINDENIKEFVINDIHDSTIKLKIDKPTMTGKHIVQLTNIIDADGCENKLNVPSISYDVRDTKPKIQFIYEDEVNNNSNILYGKQGQEFKLPIYLEGEAPWRFIVSTPNNKLKPFELIDNKATINVFEEGEYKLISVKDDYCKGEVVKGEDKFIIKYYDKPIVKLIMGSNEHNDNDYNIFKLNPVCQYQLSNQKLKFYGNGPFKLGYKFKNGKYEDYSDKLKDNILKDEYLFNLDTNNDGLNEYHLDRIGDMNYNELIKLENGIKIEQLVYKNPKASFVTNKIKHIKACKSSTIKDLQLNLIGEAPFNIELEWVDPNGNSYPVEFKNIQTKQLKFELKLPNDSIGNFKLNLINIQDKHQCQFNNPHIESINIQVYDIPAIKYHFHKDLCVGEQLQFSLIGEAPFQFYYSLNERKLGPIKLEDIAFSRLADKEGKFKVEKLCHIDNMCCNEELTEIIEIHQLPSAIIQSPNQVEKIHQGN